MSSPETLSSRSSLLGACMLGALMLVALLASHLAPIDPFATAGEPLQPPSLRWLFGTDDLGRDVYAGVVHGTATSLRIGLLAAAISATIGLLVGGFAGTREGVVDQVLMRMTEFVQILPRFFLIVTVVSLFDSHLNLVVLVLALTMWPATARVFRAQVRSGLTRDFVVAARAAGSSDVRLLIRHVLPAATSVLAAELSYQVGGAILAEAGVSFLGLGDPAVVSWGALLGAAQNTVREAWWMALFPGLALTMTVMACNLIADGMAPPRLSSAPPRLKPSRADGRPVAESPSRLARPV